MRFFATPAVLLLTGLLLAGCPGATAGLTAAGALVGAAAGPTVGRALDTADELATDAAAYRREQTERRRDFRALCDDAIRQEAGMYRLAAAQAAQLGDLDEAGRLYAMHRQVLSQGYPSLRELSPLGEDTGGVCGIGQIGPPAAEQEEDVVDAE